MIDQCEYEKEKCFKLFGKLEEFMDNTKQELTIIRITLEDLKGFKWRVMGGAALISALITIGAQLLKYWGK